MDNDELMNDLLANSIEGNAINVKDIVDTLLSGKAVEALASMKVDVAQSMYGEPEQEAPEMEMEPEEDTNVDSEEQYDAEEEDTVEYEDDEALDDQEDVEELMQDLEDLAADGEEESEDNEEN